MFVLEQQNQVTTTKAITLRFFKIQVSKISTKIKPGSILKKNINFLICLCDLNSGRYLNLLSWVSDQPNDSYKGTVAQFEYAQRWICNNGIFKNVFTFL